MSQITMTKFRPVLTLSQIRHIIELTGIHENPVDIELRKILIPMVAKIEVGAINPAYKLSETHAIKQAQIAERQRYENDLMTPEEESDYELKIMGL